MSATSHHSYEIDGQKIPVKLTSNARSKRYILRLDPGTGGVKVTMPPGGKVAEALAFVGKQENWIINHLEKRGERISFAEGVIVPFRGEEHEIAQGTNKRGVVWSEPRADGSLPLLCVSGDKNFLERRLTDWFKRQCEREISYAVAHYTRTLGAKYKNVSIRDQTSRWGSCSTSGTLSFSWRLILAPPFILDYVAAHEVAHLKEMNHSDRFWKITHELFPQTPAARKWLKAHGTQLHLYGAGKT